MLWHSHSKHRPTIAHAQTIKRKVGLVSLGVIFNENRDKVERISENRDFSPFDIKTSRWDRVIYPTGRQQGAQREEPSKPDGGFYWAKAS